MGFAWQQAPFGKHPAGRFLTEEPLPEHILYAEPAGRRMRVELAGAIVALSDGVTLLHETGRYPVAYFPLTDIDARLLRPSAKCTRHPQLARPRGGRSRSTVSHSRMSRGAIPALLRMPPR